MMEDDRRYQYAVLGLLALIAAGVWDTSVQRFILIVAAFVCFFGAFIGARIR